MFTSSHSILARCRNYFSQPLNVHGVNDIRKTEIPTAKPLVPEPSVFDFELDIEKLKARNFKISVKSKILGTCVRASMTLRRVTNLELI